MKYYSLFLLLFTLSIKHPGFAQLVSSDRPQTPVPPYDYFIDSVEYDNEAKTVRLGATFSYPRKGGPFTTIILITGSGLQDRDETIFRHKPFAVISDYFVKKGFAVLRVDDRGVGKSKGEYKTATSVDFADDVQTSINYLLTRKEVLPGKIGLIGHSEGGLIAPIVYSRWPKIAFIISLAGPGVSGAGILLKQQTDPLIGLVSETAYNAFYLLTKETLRLIHDYPLANDSVILSHVKKYYTDWKSRQPDTVLTALRADKASPEAYASQVSMELIPWLRYFITTEPEIFWSKVLCPVLVLNGEKDFQVEPVQNTQAIRLALEKANNKGVTIKILPGINHLFQECTICNFDEYKALSQTISPAVLKIMSDWLEERQNQ
jgi:uncharacterized protein